MEPDTCCKSAEQLDEVLDRLHAVSEDLNKLRDTAQHLLASLNDRHPVPPSIQLKLLIESLNDLLPQKG